jgi:heat shock protein HslJ
MKTSPRGLKMKRLSCLLLFLILVTSACTPSGQAGAKLTIPSKWKLESFGKPDSETPVLQESTITLELNENGQAGGSSGCNSYGAKYEFNGSTLKFSEVISTLMACANDQVNQQESQYLQALQGATSFKFSGDKLIIFYADGQNQLNFIGQ